DEQQELVGQLLSQEKKILQQFDPIRSEKIDTLKVRIHGDYHLGQVLYTNGDFVIIDFEGEPARPLSERKIKRSVFRDVAGMMRSFDYAAFNVLLQNNPVIRPEDVASLEPWAELWSYYIGRHFVDSYYQASEGQGIIPVTGAQREHLLQGYLMNKAVYELNYELNSRPDWASIPLRGILRLIGS
ncbi:MAG: alpha-amylase, partial [Chlorobiaceae bacterium]|nr:alpha-amylase [Chlorobiaceae bacterium]